MLTSGYFRRIFGLFNNSIWYKTGDTLSFVNQHNDTLSFRVDFIQVTNEHTTKCCCSDHPNATLEASTLPWSFYLYWRVSADDKYSNPFINFELTNYFWDSGNFKRQSNLYFYDETGKNPFDPNNNALFGETVIIEDESQLISRVTAVKGKGITGFSDQVQNFQWESIKNKHVLN